MLIYLCLLKRYYLDLVLKEYYHYATPIFKHIIKPLFYLFILISVFTQTVYINIQNTTQLYMA